MPDDNDKRIINVDAMARVEGEGALTIKFDGDRLESVELRIFEPPRLFEAFLRGRRLEEVPDITARICGICPVAYQMSSCHALEMALGVTVDGPLRALRRLLYCGEWIESHVLHMYMLHLPDFVGAADVLALSKVVPERVRDALRMKKAGNAIVNLLGGREIHPINVRVGGFYKIPETAAFRAMLDELRWGRDCMAEAATFFAGLDYPEAHRDVEQVALRHASEYPFSEGRIVSTAGLDIDVTEYGEHFEEHQVPHSTSLHARIKARGNYLCGPTARLNLNSDKLSTAAMQVADAAGLVLPVLNPFRSIGVRAVETYHAFEEAIGIIETLERPPAPAIPLPRRAGVGHGCTEAPRGILYHRYEVDAEGLVTHATIVPPTSQNQAAIEDDLTALAPRLAELPLDEATWLAEQAVRNYDPCISCSTHFLKVNIIRD